MNAPFRRDQATLAADKYDLINSRFVMDGVDANRWPSYVQDLFDRLRTRGWLQMTEIYLNIQSDSGRINEAPNLMRWWGYYSQGLEQQNKDPRAGTIVNRRANTRPWADLAELMQNAGFVNIKREQHSLPIGEWSEGTIDVLWWKHLPRKMIAPV